ncbi:MAG: RnfABCDGE type electron transport complex subunit G [Bacteroidales bacterium]|jgi:electron transport complex protein RnfG|nr:RnfABCDGE type electron transport complex subunit G [Bacteroidales bacterium]
MAKKQSTLINMLVSLCVISVIVGFCLGGVYIITKEPIEKSRIAKQEEALKIVLPAFNNDILATKKIITKDDGEIYEYDAYQDSIFVGKAMNTFSKNGFGGKIRLMVGLLPDGTINNISVLSHSETPGLGDKMDAKKSDFIARNLKKYKDNPKSFIFNVSKDGGNVDAITAATISSRAFCDAINKVTKQ